MEFKGTKGNWESVPQKGIPGHCYQAQVFVDGISMACIEPTEHEVEASANALLISKAPEMLEKLISILYMSEDKGVEGCTWGDTEMSSADVAYGYNLALDNVKSGLKELIKSATQI